MARRYLTIDEAWFALRRGRAVECFLGPCERHGVHGIHYASISLVGEQVALQVFYAADEGDADALDLYEFGPLDPSLSPDDANEEATFPTLEACIAVVRTRWPKRETQLVNESVLQDEYRDYIAAGRRI